MIAAEVDLVVCNASVVTMDDAGSVYIGGAIGIDRGLITYAGDSGNAPRGRTVVDAHGAIVCPGLFNAHAHLAMTLLRGVADDHELDGFLGRVLPIEGALVGPEFVRAGSEIAIAESLLGGITSTLDMYFYGNEVLSVAAQLGATVHNGPVFFEFDGPDHKTFGERIDEAERDLALASDTGRPVWICPHSTYLLSESQLCALAELANRHRARVHVHAAETLAELDSVASRHGGRTPFAVLRDAGLLTDRTVLAHAVHMNDADIAMVAAAGAHISHNPASNFKLASGFAPIERYMEAGINVALGTDGSASANDLDIWMAMRLASYGRKASISDPTVLSASTMVAMATRNGAAAAGTLATCGTLEVGKRADLIVMRSDSLSQVPSFNALSTLAYATSRADVDTVIHDGQIVVRSGRLANADAGEVISRAAEQIERVRTML